MKQKSVMTTQEHFAQVPQAKIQRSSFDRSHGYKSTFNSGFLIPFYCDEALPGDTFNLKLTAFARLATPIKPIMDNMYMETFFFSVPVRQIWDNWEKFNGEQLNPNSSIDFTVPQIDLTAAGAVENSIFDYMGIPIGNDITINALHLRAYNSIYNNWFRSENLVDSETVLTDDGPDPQATYGLRRRSKRPDYFTSALPWPQKGTPVTVPISGTAPVIGIGVRDLTNPFTATAQSYRQADGTDPVFPWAASDTLGLEVAIRGTAEDGIPTIHADLASATGISINELRQSFQIQRIMEKDARGGTRYPEILRAHFGVTDPQMLVLQRPEFLGGGSSMVNINPVQQQGESGTTPQGNLSAFGTVTLNGHGFTKSFTEHCILIGILNVRADLNYMQGLNRMWSRQTRYDYYWPSLAMIGEQTILNKEIYYQDTSVDEDVFGYQERYAEYRYKPSLITGLFRSGATGSLDVWHLAEEFGSVPLLNEFFIQDDPPIDRIIAVQSEPEFLFDAYISLKCARPMPLYGVPGLMDHF